jgi:hypothetical protein
MFGGPALSGHLADRLGLSTMFLITGAVAVGIAVLALWGLQKGEKVS